MIFRLNCVITGEVQTISGNPHRNVQRPDGSSFFLDPAFLFALENINRENLKLRLCERFALTEIEADTIISTLVKTRLVLEDKSAGKGRSKEAALKRPRVGILTERMKLGYGVDLVVHETASRLTALGYNVKVFTGSIDPLYKGVAYDIIQLGDGDRLSDIFSQAFFEKAIKRLAKSQIDVWILESLPFYYWRDSLKGPVIFVEHGTPFPELFPKDVSLSVRLARLTKRERVFSVIRSYDRIVAISDFIASELPPSSADRIEIIYNGCDHYRRVCESEARSFRKDLGVADDEVLLLYVGRIDFDKKKQPYKSVGNLVQVFERIRTDMPYVRLLLAGRAEPGIEKILVEKGIIPLLNVSEDKVALALAAADIFVSMSLWEGFDLPLCEAQFQGKPCVAMRCGAHPELIDGTGAGVLAENEAEFEQAIRNLASDRDLVRMMSEKANDNAKRFSWDSNVQKMQALIEEVNAAFAYGETASPVKPVGNLRFSLMLAGEVLRNEGVAAFSRLALNKLRRIIARGRSTG
ncbi:MAG: glycosyltransferase family 4 protein [Candidatus Coatesbacteria bacterium]|nr:glycosyltransferase family 4 protein [Candidatus Coatesbacteria bacterium]